jgi:hypothetical protein
MSPSQPALRFPEPHAHLAGERCPWCDQPIPHDKFDEIRARIEAKERERSAALERGLREQFAQDKAQIEAKATADLEQGWREAASAIDKVRQEAAAREAIIRREGKEAAEAAMATKLAEVEQARQAVKQQVEALKSQQQDELDQRLREQRDALEKAKTEAVNAERAKVFNEQLKLEQKLQELQRQVQRKTADELGEGAEIDLFEVLKGEFPEDRISRVGKGLAGADIVHEIVHNGSVCGRIVYDSKNRNAWRNEYVAKLCQDKLAAQADHAILSSQAFPSETRQLHLQDGVIVTNPARVIVLVHLLRKHMLQVHALRLSNDARDQKTAQVYEFITSERCAQLLERVETLAEDMLELEVEEKKKHDRTWRRRGELIRSVQRAHGEFSSEIERIIGTAATEA